MALSDEEITRLFRIRKTVMQMLRDRGYLVHDFEMELSRADFIGKYGDNMKRDDLLIQKEKRDDSSDQVYIFCTCLCLYRDQSIIMALYLVRLVKMVKKHLEVTVCLCVCCVLCDKL